MEVVKKENLQVGSPLRLTHIYSISDANLQLSPTMEKFTEEVLDADFDQTNPIMAH